jgi:predicted XRE-type DNA-binding protein
VRETAHKVLKVSDVVNKKVTKFTIDTLVDMLSRVGKPVKLEIG